MCPPMLEFTTLCWCIPMNTKVSNLISEKFLRIDEYCMQSQMC